MINGKDLWGIVHILTHDFTNSKLRTRCGLREPLRAEEGDADCAYCVAEQERVNFVRERRAQKEVELDELRRTDPDKYMTERERFMRGQWR